MKKIVHKPLAALACTLGLLCPPAPGRSDEPAPASRPAAAARASASASAPARRLDLATPAAARVIAPAQLHDLLAAPDAQALESSVSVEGERYLEPVPMGQVQAIYWAFLHPKQAWRIFTPVVQP